MNNTFKAIGVALANLMLVFQVGQARADEIPVFNLALKNHAYVPQELVLPAQQKVKIIITNQDATPAEFESFELNREKVVPAQSEITVFIGPLDAGSYNFFDDFHRDTATGKLVVK